MPEKMHRNLKAFLDMIAFSELGPSLIESSDNGYNVIVGSTPKVPILFHDYSDHPRRKVTIRPGLVSTAAGRYQILARSYDAYKQLLSLQDFSPQSQDAIAIHLVKECMAIDKIKAGRFAETVHSCRSRWASLPGSGYGQHENQLEQLEAAYIKAGGIIA